ncbi:hypothetical protein CBR_g20980 [Chara braunii]|uniref:Pre-PUA domain-containing protein n=1 Tax=Chara braunii TaxID=69332 RepID=A0A388L0K6_CHABU|nr:hypothetical protein CBR_g20980 [Chara braunii]|eukprot:GBG75733.1 hypothetical protein CBR_g20980 [Chara braunii]
MDAFEQLKQQMTIKLEENRLSIEHLKKQFIEKQEESFNLNQLYQNLQSEMNNIQRKLNGKSQPAYEGLATWKSTFTSPCYFSQIEAYIRFLEINMNYSYFPIRKAFAVDLLARVASVAKDYVEPLIAKSIKQLLDKAIRQDMDKVVPLIKSEYNYCMSLVRRDAQMKSRRIVLKYQPAVRKFQAASQLWILLDPIVLFVNPSHQLPLLSPFAMFKKFTPEESISGHSQVKASVQRKIRSSIAEEYPPLEPFLDELMPKKAPLVLAKCQNHLNLVVVNHVPLFFNIRDGPYMPTLRLLHQCATHRLVTERVGPCGGVAGRRKVWLLSVMASCGR